MSRNYQNTEEFIREGERHADRATQPPRLLGEAADPLIPTAAQQAAQGALCSCRGTDEWCPCQNTVQP